MQNYKIESSSYGKRLVVTSNWTDNMVAVIQQNNITDLYLNYAHGWKGSDLNFLKLLPSLKAFTIIDWAIDNIAPIHNLHELLYIEIGTYCKTPVDFSNFPHLQVCRFEWRPKSDSIFNCTMLAELFLNRYKGKSSKAFSNLINLQSLSIASSALAEINYLKNLNKLNFLGLYELKKLSSLTGIEDLVNLNILEITGCIQINSLEPVKNLKTLERLHIINSERIDSLSPVGNLPRLQELIFYESTNVVDGDLTYIFKLDNLKKVAFQNRRHYTHTREEIDRWIANKNIVI